MAKSWQAAENLLTCYCAQVALLGSVFFRQA